jgi:peptide/nickel transport system permease protein
MTTDDASVRNSRRARLKKAGWLVPPVLVLSMAWEPFTVAAQSLIYSMPLLTTDPAWLVNVTTVEVLEKWFAAAGLAAWLAGAVWFVLARRETTPAAGRTTLWRESFKSHWRKNLLTRLSGYYLLGLYGLTVLAPLVTPYHPNHQQDLLVTRNLPPLSRVPYVRLKTVSQQASVDGGLAAGLPYTVQSINARLTRPEPDLLYVTEFVRNDSSIVLHQDRHIRSIPLTDLAGPTEAEFAGAHRHFLGTDKFGRDIFSRMLVGARVSLFVVTLALVIAFSLGVVIGVAAGYFGGGVDTILMRSVDLMLAFPVLFLILLIVGLIGSSTVMLVLLLGLTGWMGVSRLVRGEVLSLKQRTFILSARALGLGSRRIIFRHLLPNAMTPVIVAATLRVGGLILVEAGLSYLGLGVQPPTASWGNMISEGRDVLLHAWWIATFPGLALVVTVVAFNLFGDALRETSRPGGPAPST